MEAIFLKKFFFLIRTKVFLKIWVNLNQISLDKLVKTNLGCVPYGRTWVFFQNFQNSAFLLLYYSGCKKATAMVFTWEYPAVRFEHRTAFERYFAADLWAKQFWVFFEKLKYRIFSKTPKLFCFYLSNQMVVGRFISSNAILQDTRIWKLFRYRQTHSKEF